MGASKAHAALGASVWRCRSEGLDFIASPWLEARGAGARKSPHSPSLPYGPPDLCCLISAWAPS